MMVYPDPLCDGGWRIFFLSSRRRHTRCGRDWSSDVCSSDLAGALQLAHVAAGRLDGFIELSLNAWDASAGLLLIEEAGGYAGPFPGPAGLLVPAPVLGCAKEIAWPLVEIVGVW